jgi:hypothetical protein
LKDDPRLFRGGDLDFRHDWLIVRHEATVNGLSSRLVGLMDVGATVAFRHPCYLKASHTDAVATAGVVLTRFIELTNNGVTV